MASPAARITTAVTASVALLAGCAAPGAGPASPATSTPTTALAAPGTAAPGGGTTTADPAAAGNPHPREDLADGGTLTLAIDAIPRNLNRFHLDGALEGWRQVTTATDPGLYRYSPDGDIAPRPEYLTAMPTVKARGDGQVITYHLNPKAVWNDGTPLDWTAFDATWKAHRTPPDRGGAPSVPTPAYAAVTSVARGAGPHDVVVTTATATYPVTDLFAWLLHPRLADPAAFAGLMKDDPHPELRSGPFVVAGVDRRNGVVTLDRNPRWWGRTPVLDHVRFRQLDPGAALTALQGKELDVADVAQAAAYARLRDADGIDVRRGPGLATTVLLLNTASPTLTPPVRAAIWQGIDRAELARVRFHGLDVTVPPAESALTLPVDHDETPTPAAVHDPDAARTTLDRAGWTPGPDGIRTKDGSPLTVRFTLHGDDPLGTALAQTVRTQLRPVGIEVRIDARPLSAFGTTMSAKDYDLLLGGGTIDSPDPTATLCQTMCSDSPGNASGAGTPDLDSRIKAAQGIADDTQRARTVARIEHDWLAIHGQLPLWHAPAVVAARHGLANFGPTGFSTLTPAWEDTGWQQGSTPTP